MRYALTIVQVGIIAYNQTHEECGVNMMNKSDLAICGYCLEPVTSPLCPSCLSRSIEMWLEKEGVGRGFIQEIKNNMEHSLTESENNIETCIKCHEESRKVICPFCFVNETYHELKPLDWIRAEKLKILFNFGDPEHGTMSDMIVSENVIPLTDEWDSQTEENMCENCENHSLFLHKPNGRWLCEDCIESY